MEKRRELNISFGKSGKGSISPRLNIPKKFLDVLEITQENRSIILELDEEKKSYHYNQKARLNKKALAPLKRKQRQSVIKHPQQVNYNTKPLILTTIKLKEMLKL